MNFPGQNSTSGTSGSGDFEETLRMIVRLPAPEGLEERVRAGLRSAPAGAGGGARIIAWPVARGLDTAWMRSAAAAAIVAVVIGGCWQVYSRVQMIQPTRAITVPLHLFAQGGFSSAGAMRTPQTLNGPMAEHPATMAPVPGKPVLRPPVRQGKSGLGTAAGAGKATEEPAHTELR